jgi:hypothetical protein
MSNKTPGHGLDCPFICKCGNYHHIGLDPEHGEDNLGALVVLLSCKPSSFGISGNPEFTAMESYYSLAAHQTVKYWFGMAQLRPSRPCRPLFLSRGMPIPSDLSNFPLA